MEAELLNALQQLVAEGKTPTTALLKNRVRGRYPLPQLISAIKTFSANPTVSATSSKTKAPKAKTMAELQQQVDAMQQQMEQMAAQIAQLQQQR